MTLQAIKWDNGKLEVLDQILLPAISRYVVVNGVEDGWKVINKMQVCFWCIQKQKNFPIEYNFPSLYGSENKNDMRFPKDRKI